MKDIEVIVKIDNKPITQKEKDYRLAQFLILLHKWQIKDKEKESTHARM